MTGPASEDLAQRLKFYSRHLEDDVLEWWLTHAVDHEFGGVFTFWNGSGTEILSTDKYVWSQGRWAWTLSALARLAETARLPSANSADLLAMARKTMRFLRDGAVLEDGTCANFVTREGVPTLGFTGTSLHSSVYADLFVALGFAGLAQHECTEEWSAPAERLLESAAHRIKTGTAVTAPYPIAPGFSGFAPHMILINTATEVYRATGSSSSALIAADAAETVLREFSVGPDICEIRADDPAYKDTVEARHRNPGHVLESLWFILDSAEAIPEVSERLGPGLVDRLVEHFLLAATRGWDEEYGGLFRFVDQTGGRPQGRQLGGKYERVVLETWDTKLWWPHNDALYAALMLWTRTGDEALLEWFNRLDDYAFSSFPAGPGREWNQILNRVGEHTEPDAKSALPVKDPYHLMRALLLLIELEDDLDSAPRKDRS